jgi:hypothetical protein
MATESDALSLERTRYTQKLMTLECAKSDLKQLDTHRTLDFASPLIGAVEQVHSDEDPEDGLSEDGQTLFAAQYEEPNDNNESNQLGETEINCDTRTKKKKRR